MREGEADISHHKTLSTRSALRYAALTAATTAITALGMVLDGEWILVGATVAAYAWISALTKGFLDLRWRSVSESGVPALRPDIPLRTVPSTAPPVTATRDQAQHPTALAPLITVPAGAPESTTAAIPLVKTASTEPQSVQTMAGAKPAVPLTPTGTVGAKDRNTHRRRMLPLTAEHYRRHAGLPGFLYVARNSEHRQGLYKVGYTTVGGAERSNSLNLQLRIASDVGRFQLVFSIPAAAAYDAEQLVFEVLDGYRVVPGREFFQAPETFLIECVSAVAAQCNDDFGLLNDLRTKAREKKRETSSDARPEHPRADVPERLSPAAGWVYIVRNDYHRTDTFRVGYSATDPAKRIGRLNAIQRRMTSQIGFYRLVASQSALNPKGSFMRLLKLIANRRIDPRRPFFNAPLAYLAEALTQVVTADLATGGQPETNPPEWICKRHMDALNPKRNMAGDCDPDLPIVGTRTEDSAGTVFVQSISGLISSSWAPWTAGCGRCGVVLRFTGAIGATSVVACPECGLAITCRVGARAVVIGTQR